MWRVTVMVFVLAAAARAQFPFTDSPLEPTINSNKVFFNMTSLKDIAGVWKGINTVYPPLIEDPDLYDGVFNMTCDYSLGGGWNYDFFISFPLSITIEVDENSLEEGIIGNYIEAGVFWVPEAGEFRPQTRRFGIRDFSTSDGLAALDIDACRMWRPYFDWEVGKTMLLRKYRYFFFPDENGQSQFNELEGCINSDDEHPMCTEGDFEIDGGSHTGVIIDTPMWMECIAGPCLDLPFTLDGYVQTQGYIPAWVNSDGK